MVGVGFGVGDGAGYGAGGVSGGLDDEGCGDGETPGVGALVAVDEGDIDHDGAVVLLHGLGDGVGDAEGGGEVGAGVGEEREGEVVLLDGEVVLAGELGGDADEESAVLAGIIFPGLSHFFICGLPGFELGHAVGAPAASEEEDDERADGEEVGGADQLAGGGGAAEGCGGCGGEVEGWSGGADGEDAVFDAGGEEGLDGGVGDGEAVGLDESARLGGDVVEFGLEVGGVRHLVLV